MNTPKQDKIPLDSPAHDLFPQFKKMVGDWKPRVQSDTCLLCLSREAGKKESHIFPNFFTKSIFRDPAKRRLIVTDGINKVAIKSSTPKEDYILCHSCEGKLGALERLISLVLPKAFEQMRASNDFSASEREHHIESIGINPALFHLFVYSMLWRAHITQQRELVLLTLSKEHAEELRSILNSCLDTKEAPMVEAMEKLLPTRLPLYYQTVMAYEKPDNQSQTIIGLGWKYDSDYGYRLYTNDFLFKFSASDEEMDVEPRGATHLGSTIAISAQDWEKTVATMQGDVINMNQFTRSLNESGPLRPS